MDKHEATLQYLLVLVLVAMMVAPMIWTVPEWMQANYNGVLMAVFALLNIKPGAIKS